jgi:hypothetical protein
MIDNGIFVFLSRFGDIKFGRIIVLPGFSSKMSKIRPEQPLLIYSSGTAKPLGHKLVMYFPGLLGLVRLLTVPAAGTTTGLKNLRVYVLHGDRVGQHFIRLLFLLCHYLEEGVFVEQAELLAGGVGAGFFEDGLTGLFGSGLGGLLEELVGGLLGLA